VSGSSLVSRSALPSARITSGANNTSTSASLSHVISQPSSVSTSSSSLTCSTRTSAAPSVSAAVPASTMTTSSTSLSSSYTYQPFVPLSRRKPSEDDATGLVSPTARSVANTSTGSVARRWETYYYDGNPLGSIHSVISWPATTRVGCTV